MENRDEKDRYKPKSWAESVDDIWWYATWNPLAWLDWLLSVTVYTVRRSGIFQALALVATVWVGFNVYNYVTSSEQRRQERIADSWRIINSAADIRGGGGGRVLALEELHQYGVSLRGVDVDGAFLSGLNLDTADIGRARLGSAYLDSASFRGAIANEVDFSRSDLRGAVFDGANLVDADFRGSQLSRASVRNADMRGADVGAAPALRSDQKADWERNLWNALQALSGRSPGISVDSAVTILTSSLPVASIIEPVRPVFSEAYRADFSKANLSSADLRSGHFGFADFRGSLLRFASIHRANFMYADLRNADLHRLQGWKQAVLVGANVSGVRNAPDGFREWALNQGAVQIGLNEEWSGFRRQSSFGVVQPPPFPQVRMPRTFYSGRVKVNCQPLKERNPDWVPGGFDELCLKEPSDEIPGLFREQGLQAEY